MNRFIPRLLLAAALVLLIEGAAWAQPAPPKDAKDQDLEWLSDPESNVGPCPGATSQANPAPAAPKGPGLGISADPIRREIDRSRAGSLDKIKREDPARYQRIKRIKDLADEYRKTEDPARRRAIEKELHPLVDQELKVQQDENKKRIERLEQKLTQMKETLRKREENWDQVVDYTVRDITGQNDRPKPNKE